MSQGRLRLLLVEYGKPVDIGFMVNHKLGIDRMEAKRLLLSAGNRVSIKLGLSYNPITLKSEGVRAVGFAGLIKLTPLIDLEIVPKFLGNKAESIWREDFFFLCTLSRYGNLLSSEGIAASGGGRRGLSTLIARSICSMYASFKRRPLRTYRNIRTSEFSLDGDPEPLDIILPSPDGFEQELTSFDRRNSWNSNILGAAKELLPEVNDPHIASSLLKIIQDLSPQNLPISRRKPVPSRDKLWKPLHDLSLDVLDGLGLNYRQGRAHAPGYLIVTWRIWEELITIGARLGFGSSVTFSQKGFMLGHKLKPNLTFSRKISVFPDCVIESARSRFLLDAKYKGHVEKDHMRISEADIYESLAFCRAASCNYIVLVYPSLATSPIKVIGTCSLLEVIEIDDIKIFGVQVESRGISQRMALKQFGYNMSTGIERLLFG